VKGFYSLRHHIQIGCENHPASCLMCTGGFFPMGKVARF